jgi:CBS domain-containing protein
MLLFVAVFVFFGAQQEALYATAKEDFEETRVVDIMQPLPPVFARGTTVLTAVQMAMRDSRASYPLVDSGLRILGLIPAEDLARALHDRPSEPVDRLAHDHTATIPAQASLRQARDIMRAGLQKDYPVTNEANQLVGYLSRGDLPASFLGADHAELARVGSGR